MTSKVISKHISRLAAVQFVYQLEITNKSSPEVVEEFVNTYIKSDEAYQDINLRFFKKLVSYINTTENLEQLIEETLQSQKSLYNLSVMELCILKTAIVEMVNTKTDLPIIINEYVEIAKDFFEQGTTRFINALLDALSKKVERKCLIEA